MSLIKHLFRPIAKTIWHGFKHVLEFCGWDYVRIFQIRRGIHLIIFQTDLMPNQLSMQTNTYQPQKNEFWKHSDYTSLTALYKDIH